MTLPRLSRCRAVALALLALPMLLAQEEAPGLQPNQPLAQELILRDHQVDVQILNGFAAVAVEQVYHNPNPQVLEARYRVPLPEQGILSEFSIERGDERVQHGEVVARDQAQQIYQSERDQGREAGLAEKDSYQWFTFQVSAVPAQGEVRLRHRYYQPLTLDNGIGRFSYPREHGGTEDPAATSFWTGNVSDTGTNFRFRCELLSSWPLADVRLPGYQVVQEQPAEDRWVLSFDEASSSGKDVVVYYRLADDLPGRVELIPYKPDADKPGYFMLVLTPGLDLQPRLPGVDYSFVVDVSGSMQGKLGTLADGVQRAIGRLRSEDRFRLVTFSTDAQEIVPLRACTPEHVQQACQVVAGLQTQGSTNLHAGLQQGLRRLDDDRAHALVLLTDGVTNTGVVSPQAFDALSRQHDVRIFGFLLGNSANWPLMNVICQASGGFYQSISNQDDILGQLLLAKEKMTRECLHDAQLRIRGVETFDTTDGQIGKIYHGQQLVLFGRYRSGGRATLTLDARLTGGDKRYECSFDFPDTATDYPELERLWAMNRVEDIEYRALLGQHSATESENAIRDLGVQYQIVTDETAMLVVDDAVFTAHGIERRNQERTARESSARAARAQAPVPVQRVDRDKPMFDRPANTLQRTGGGGGGAGSIEAWLVVLLAAIAAAVAWRHRRQAC